MPKLMLDTSEYKERTPLEAGVYDAVIDTRNEECVIKTSEKGTQYVPVRFLVSTDDGEYQLTRNFMVSGKGVNITLRALRDLGMWDGDTSKPVQFDTLKLHGMRCKVKVTQREYQGKIVNDIEAVLPAEGAVAGSKKAVSF